MLHHFLRAASQNRLLKPGGFSHSQAPARLKQAVLTCSICLKMRAPLKASSLPEGAGCLERRSLYIFRT